MTQEQFGAAVRTALADQGMTIQMLADHLDLPHSTVSSWLTKARPPEPEKVFEIERTIGLAPGQLSSLLGYLPLDAVPGRSTAEAIALDPLLDARGRRSLLAAYQALVEG